MEYTISTGHGISNSSHTSTEYHRLPAKRIDPRRVLVSHIVHQHQRCHHGCHGSRRTPHIIQATIGIGDSRVGSDKLWRSVHCAVRVGDDASKCMHELEHNTHLSNTLLNDSGGGANFSKRFYYIVEKNPEDGVWRTLTTEENTELKVRVCDWDNGGSMGSWKEN